MSEHDKLREAISTARSRTSYAADRVLVEALQVVYAAAESTLPQTKMVDTWRVDFAFRANFGWEPLVNTFTTQAEADQRAADFRARSKDYACIRVTGPHQQEIPA